MWVPGLQACKVMKSTGARGILQLDDTGQVEKGVAYLVEPTKNKHYRNLNRVSVGRVLEARSQVCAWRFR